LGDGDVEDLVLYSVVGVGGVGVEEKGRRGERKGGKYLQSKQE
jgi:hypothetical protein